MIEVTKDEYRSIGGNTLEFVYNVGDGFTGRGGVCFRMDMSNHKEKLIELAGQVEGAQ